MENILKDLLLINDHVSSDANGRIHLEKVTDDICLIKVLVFGKFYALRTINNSIDKVRDTVKYMVKNSDDMNMIICTCANVIVMTAYKQKDDVEVVNVMVSIIDSSTVKGYRAESGTLYVLHGDTLAIIPYEDFTKDIKVEKF